TMRREWKARPAITSWSAMRISPRLLYILGAAPNISVPSETHERPLASGTNGSRKVLRAGFFNVGVESNDDVLVALFNDPAFQLQRVGQLAVGVREVLIQEGEALGLLILRER